MQELCVQFFWKSKIISKQFKIMKNQNNLQKSPFSTLGETLIFDDRLSNTCRGVLICAESIGRGDTFNSVSHHLQMVGRTSSGILYVRFFWKGAV